MYELEFRKKQKKINNTQIGAWAQKAASLRQCQQHQQVMENCWRWRKSLEDKGKATKEQQATAAARVKEESGGQSESRKRTAGKTHVMAAYYSRHTVTCSSAWCARWYSHESMGGGSGAVESMGASMAKKKPMQVLSNLHYGWRLVMGGNFKPTPAPLATHPARPVVMPNLWLSLY